MIKKNLSIILSLLSLIGVLVIIGLIIFKDISLWTITLDSFVGVMVSIMGILITFVVGWQIINTLEIKSKLSELDQVKEDIRVQGEMLNESVCRSQHLISYTWALDAFDNEEDAESYRYAVHSLLNSMQLKEPINIDALLILMKHCTDNMPQGFRIKRVLYDLVIEDDKRVRELSGYTYVQERYEPCFNMYLKKVKPI